MIEALPEKPGWLAIIDAKSRRHVVSASAAGKPQSTGPGTTYLKLVHYENLFVCCPIDEVKAALKQARVLRKAQIATEKRRQLSFDFDKKEEAGAATPASNIAPSASRQEVHD